MDQRSMGTLLRAVSRLISTPGRFIHDRVGTHADTQLLQISFFPLYRQFGDWILDNQRRKIDRRFISAAF